MALQDLTTSSTRPIAFLFPDFPVLHQTFVLGEVLALRALGMPLVLYSLRRPCPRQQQPEAEVLIPEVRYLPMLSAAILVSNLRVATSTPGRYLRTFGRLVSAWWEDRHVKKLWSDRTAAPEAAERMLTPRERWRAFFNVNPWMYLLRSLALVPAAVQLGQELRRAGIDHVHAHWATYPTTVALIAHWLFGIRFSFTAHAYDIYLAPQLLSAKLRAARHAVTCARVNASYLEKIGGPDSGSHITVSYHGVDLQRFAPVGPQPSISGPPCIVTCGRLQIYKGHHVLLRAFAQLEPPARCIVIGDGPQRANLERLAATLGIADRVQFTGPLPQSEVARYLSQATVFALASIVVTSYGKRDVIPNVLAEAMAMGVPVVASDISGIGELIRDGESGRLVPPNDDRTLARVLAELIADPQKRRHLARGGYCRVRSDFDRQKNVRTLAALLQQISRA